MNKGKEFLSALKQYSDYLKYKDEIGRYETWDEACEEVLMAHVKKYGIKVMPLVEEVLPMYRNKDLLASQRALQFRHPSLIKHNAKQYNCSVMYAYSPDMFKKGFYLLLCGCGLGVNLKRKYTQHLPNIHNRGEDTITFIINDSIEGWCEAIHALISTYCKHPSLNSDFFSKRIRFDYSNIRERGSFISGGFAAPGPDGLKQSLEFIETLIEKELKGKEEIPFRNFIVYNIFMHLADAVLSGGVRRSAMNIIIDMDDEEMVHAKTGNWRENSPHFARSNNSVGMKKGSFTKEEFTKLIALNEGDNDIGFVLLETEDQMFNPCFEISFDFFNKITDLNDTVIQMCNLCEINASACKTKDGKLNTKKFFEQCRAASIIGTLQAGWASFPYLGSQTEDIVSGEALLGISITGWMDNPELFNAEILREGVKIVKETNKEVADIIGISYAARLTCTKPSGNASVVLGTPSGIHPEHSEMYFRVMQLHKDSEVAKWIETNMPELLEESQWSATKSDYVVFVPIENGKNAIFKKELRDIKHLELIKLVQEHWVFPGTNAETAYNPNHHHNVSNTVIIDNKDEIVDYIFNNQEYFVAVSFLSRFGDKDFTQAPFTSVLNTEQLIKEYGDSVVFMSGLIVDGLHYFNNDLWRACSCVSNRDYNLYGTRDQVLLQQDWVRRVKKFAKNYMKNDLTKTIYCIKDVHLSHKWNTVNRIFTKIPDFANILKKPLFKNMDELGAVACAGGACEI